MIATEKQINFILSLSEKRDTNSVNPIIVGCIEDIEMGYADSISKKYASRMIEVLLESPMKKIIRDTLSPSIKVEDGRYAIIDGDRVRFFQVNSPTSGRWDGYTFVNEQAGSELYSVRNAKQREDILRMIANDDQALARYGQELGYCGMCNRELTDETSRAIGIGPVCRNK